MTYTDEDVQRLVDACKNLGRITHNRSVWIESTSIDHVKQALAPFQPDPDAELVEQVRRFDFSGLKDIERYKAIIAAVREHDRGKG